MVALAAAAGDRGGELPAVRGGAPARAHGWQAAAEVTSGAAGRRRRGRGRAARWSPRPRSWPGADTAAVLAPRRGHGDLVVGAVHGPPRATWRLEYLAGATACDDDLAGGGRSATRRPARTNRRRARARDAAGPSLLGGPAAVARAAGRARATSLGVLAVGSATGRATAFPDDDVRRGRGRSPVRPPSRCEFARVGRGPAAARGARGPRPGSPRTCTTWSSSGCSPWAWACRGSATRLGSDAARERLSAYIDDIDETIRAIRQTIFSLQQPADRVRPACAGRPCAWCPRRPGAGLRARADVRGAARRHRARRSPCPRCSPCCGRP